MSGKKHTLAELDAGQLEMMWQFLRMRPEEETCTRKDKETEIARDMRHLRQAPCGERQSKVRKVPNTSKTSAAAQI